MGLVGLGANSNWLLAGRKREPASRISRPAISKARTPKGSGSWKSGTPKDRAESGEVMGEDSRMMASPGAELTEMALMIALSKSDRPSAALITSKSGLVSSTCRATLPAKISIVVAEEES